MPFVEMDRGRAAPEHAGEPVASGVRHLGGAVQLDHVTSRVVAAERAAGLQRRTGMASDREIELDDHMRPGEGGFEVAIALADDVGFAAVAGCELARRVFRGQQDRQFLDPDIDEVGSVFGEIWILGKNGGDRLADIAHSLARQHRLQIGRQPCDLGRRGAEASAQADRRKIRNVARGPHRNDPRRCQRRRAVDRNDPAMRIGRADDPHVQLMREGKVGDKASLAGQQRRILEP